MAKQNRGLSGILGSSRWNGNSRICLKPVENRGPVDEIKKLRFIVDNRTNIVY